jgi:integrase
MRDTVLAHHLRHLRAALSWAVSVGLLPKVPDMHMPKRAKGRTLMRGRPIAGEEFDRMLAVVPKVRPQDSAVWVHYLTGLWLSGLRLEESLALSWDQDEAFTVDLTGRQPAFRIYAEAEKGHQDRVLPMTPDFAEWLLHTPEAERVGRVFKVNGLQTRAPISPKRVGRLVSKISQRAGVVVNKGDGKYASAHDLRRAFGTRWASKVKPATLQLLMRHTSIETTLRCYVAQNAADVADELWASYGAPASGQPKGENRATYNNPYNKAPSEPQETTTAPAESSTEALDAKEVTQAEGKGLEHPKKTRGIRAFLPKAVQIPVQVPIKPLCRPISPALSLPGRCSPRPFDGPSWRCWIASDRLCR